MLPGTIPKSAPVAVLLALLALPRVVHAQSTSVYVPQAQWAWAETFMTLVIRTAGDPRALAAGLAGGLIVAGLTAGTLHSMLYGVEPSDPATFVATALVLGTGALAAGLIPARRAARIDPAVTLRE